jgi:hypothetical protein
MLSRYCEPNGNIVGCYRLGRPEQEKLGPGPRRRLVWLACPVNDGLDVRAVWVEDVGAVVARVVVRPLLGRTVVAVAGRREGLVEVPNGLPVGGGKGNMEILARRGAVREEREGRPCAAELAALVPASSVLGLLWLPLTMRAARHSATS